MKISRKTIGFALIILLLLFSSLFSLKLFLRQRNPRDLVDITTFPYEVGKWKGEDIGVSEQDYQILETRNLILRQYTHPNGEKIALFIIYSETNRSVFHPPEVCIIGSGIQITDKQTEYVENESYKISTNKMFIENNGAKQILLYGYRVGKTYTYNYYQQQVLFALNQFLGKDKSGATIRVSTIGGEEKLPILKDFLTRITSIIDSLTSRPF